MDLGRGHNQPIISPPKKYSFMPQKLPFGLPLFFRNHILLKVLGKLKARGDGGKWSPQADRITVSVKGYLAVLCC